MEGTAAASTAFAVALWIFDLTPRSADTRALYLISVGVDATVVGVVSARGTADLVLILILAVVIEPQPHGGAEIADGG